MDASATHTFALMSPEECDRLTVPFAEIEARLSGVLAEHGVAIVPDVASPEDCAALEALFSQDLYSALDNPAAALRTAEEAGPEHESLVQALREVMAAGPDHAAQVWPPGTPLGRRGAGGASTRGLPQGRFAWAARLHPRVRACYAALHGTSDLCVGLDQPFFVPRATPDDRESKRLWPHADHNVHSTQGGGDEVFQSVLYVWGSNRDGASTTIVQPGSHRDVYDTLMRDPAMVARRNNHFCQASHHSAQLNHDHNLKPPLAYAPQISAMADASAAAELWASYLAQARRVPVPAGGLFIWSSRTMHQGHAGGSRLAMPVCWEPVERRSPDVRARKARLVLSGLASSHWASLGLQHGCARSKAEALPAQPAPPGESWTEAQLPLQARPPLPEQVTAGGVGTDAARDVVLADARRDFRHVDADRGLRDVMLAALSAAVRDAL